MREKLLYSDVIVILRALSVIERDIERRREETGRGKSEK